MLYYKYSKGKENRTMKVRFELNYLGYVEILEFDDDTTEKEINEAYDKWLQELGAGWDYYEDEDEYRNHKDYPWDFLPLARGALVYKILKKKP